MSIAPFALALVLAASVLWSCLDAARKRLVRDVSPLPVLFGLSVGVLPFYLAWWGATGWGGGEGLASREYWVPALGSIAGNVAANLAFLAAFRLAPLSSTVPLLSLTPVFATFFAIPLLGEVPERLQWVGIGLVVAGALWLHPPSRDMLRRGSAGQGVALAALTALIWSVTPSLDKLALTQAGGPLHAIVINLGIGLAVAGILAVRGSLREIFAAGRTPGTLLLSLAVGSSALALQFMAMEAVPIGLLETIKRGLGNFLAVALWGRFFFAEPISARAVVASLVMAAGVGLLLL